jgi:hypothetical protein
VVGGHVDGLSTNSDGEPNRNRALASCLTRPDKFCPEKHTKTGTMPQELFSWTAAGQAWDDRTQSFAGHDKGMISGVARDTAMTNGKLLPHSDMNATVAAANAATTLMAANTYTVPSEFDTREFERQRDAFPYGSKDHEQVPRYNPAVRPDQNAPSTLNPLSILFLSAKENKRIQKNRKEREPFKKNRPSKDPKLRFKGL